MSALETTLDKAEGIAFTTKVRAAATGAAVTSAATTAYWVADEEVEEHTGESISDHVADGAEKAGQAITGTIDLAGQMFADIF
jgi:hypothetical protein